jgi:hypothetical protein
MTGGVVSVTCVRALREATGGASAAAAHTTDRPVNRLAEVSRGGPTGGKCTLSEIGAAPSFERVKKRLM